MPAAMADCRCCSHAITASGWMERIRSSTMLSSSQGRSRDCSWACHASIRSVAVCSSAGAPWMNSAICALSAGIPTKMISARTPSAGSARMNVASVREILRRSIRDTSGCITYASTSARTNGASRKPVVSSSQMNVSIPAALTVSRWYRVPE